jgi:RecA/RadA recombinase
MLEHLDFPKGISLVYGAPATGKSTLCFQLVASNPGKVIFIDTENCFNIERIQEMNPLLDLNNIILIKATRYSEQYAAVKNLSKVKNLSLVIIDSFTHYYRRKLQEKVVIQPPTVRMLKMLGELNVPVILTSQVYSISGKISPVGSDLFRRYASYRIRLDYDKDYEKRALVIEGEGLSIPFVISGKGLKV